MLHDIAWPLAPPRLMRDVAVRAFDAGAAAAAAVPDRPAGRLEAMDGFVSLADAPLAVVQSPAVFRRDVLERALGSAGAAEESFWELIRRLPVPIAPVPNDPRNIRIATGLDWEIVRKAIWPALRRRGAPG
jgi:2-C-methyl-D-erythritol 4-phosphate cytidylyltransferase